MRMRNLERMLAPRRVALVGANARPGAVGAVFARRLLDGGFGGIIDFVSPSCAEVFGVACARSVDALPAAPDLAVVATPVEATPGVLAALAARGAGAAVVAAERADAAQTRAMCDAAGAMRLLGPDSMGVQVPRLGLDASYAHMAPQDGPLGLISQSGAVVTALIDWAQGRGVGFSTTVALGDMADVDVGEMLDALAADPHTRAILLYLEQIRDARGFMSAARAAARLKPVIVARGGRVADPSQDALYDAAFRRAGLLRVDDLDAMFDAAEALARRRAPRRDRLAIVTNAAGAGVLAADAADRADVQLAAFEDKTKAALREALPAHAAAANPLDVLGDAGTERWTAALIAALADGGVDGVLAIYGPTGLSRPEDAAAAILAAEKTQTLPSSMRKPVMAALLGAAAVAPARAMLEAGGAAVFDTPGNAVAAFGYLAGHARAQTALSRTPPGLSEDRAPDRVAAAAVIAAALAAGRTRLTEPEAEAVLAAYGAPITPGAVAKTPAEVKRLAADLLVRDAPGVAVKLVSPDLISKSEVGGVRLNLATAVEARDAAQAMLTQAARLAPGARIDGLLVQPMRRQEGGHELLLAVETDPVFGPVLYFGRGGLSVEVVADKAVALPPLDLGMARDLIAATRTGRLMQGGRGLAAADIDAVAITLVRLAQLVADLPQVTTLEINPLLAGPDGCVALDARIGVAANPPCAPGANPRFAIRPYPSDWDRIETVKGRRIRMRPIRPEDETLYPDFLDAVDPADMRLRFFSAIARPSHAQLAKLTQIDYARAMAFVAIDPEDGALLGVSRLACDPGGEEAEYAVLVRSALHGQGVGWALMQRLIAYAKAEGLKALHGEVMDGNGPMLGMCRALGFTAHDHPDDPSLQRVRLALQPG